MNAKEKLTKAKSMLIIDHPFFGCLAVRLELIEDASYPTAATDGHSIYYNPKFIDGLDTPQTVGLLAHEVMHCALGHIWRMGDKDMGQWNIAADYAINENLIKAGLKLPKGALLDHQYYSKSAEEIYALLPPQTANDGGGNGNGNDPIKNDPGQCGGVIPAPNKKMAEAIHNKWRAAVSQARIVSKNSIPDDLNRQIDKIINPTLPWHVLLRDFVEYNAKNDYNWSRPNRRYTSQGIVMPTLISEELPEIVVAIDTSGSIRQKELDTFAAEVSGIFEIYDTTVHVIYCDSKVQHVESFSRHNLPIRMNPKGGGCTRFQPVFDYINTHGMQPKGLIYFTDLAGLFPDTAPDYPVMWITKSKARTAPFGQTIRFEDGV